MTTLAALVSELQSEVPAVDSVPSTDQYTQAVKDAVTDFSRRCGLAKISTLAVVSGTATYDLPTDFLRMIAVDALVGVDGVMISQTGLVPVSKDFEETYTVANLQITFYPTPRYTMTRYIKYMAGWVLTGGTDYATMGNAEKEVVMLKAKSIANDKLARAIHANGAVKYSLGAVSVDRGGGAEAITNLAFRLHGEYVEACDLYNGRTMLAGGL